VEVAIARCSAASVVDAFVTRVSRNKIFELRM